MLKNIIFDLGGVLIDWNPRFMYRKIFDNEATMEEFLQTVCTDEWNIQQDSGNTLAAGTEELCKKYPEKADLIRMYYARWPEMLAGQIQGTVDILHQLQQQNYNLFALTNWSHETFPYARNHFGFLQLFQDIVVSGEEKIMKPDHRIYQILLSRNNIDAKESIFIDDNLKNINAAKELGITAIHFTSPPELALSLRKLSIIQ